jgi:hypothetical protein
LRSCSRTILASMTAAVLLIGGCSAATPTLPTNTQPAALATLTASSSRIPSTVRPEFATIRAENTQAAQAQATEYANAYATATVQAPIHNATSTAAAFQTAVMDASINALAAQQAPVLDRAPGPFEPLSWPMPDLTDAQIAQARSCNFYEIYDERYEPLPISEFESVYRPDTVCDYAALAAAYVARTYNAYPRQPVPTEAFTPYITAVQVNPAFLLKNALITGFIGQADLVEAPPFTENAVTHVEMHYTFDVIGYETEATVVIDQANTAYPVVTGTVIEYDLDTATPTPAERPLPGTIAPALVQALGKSLTDLVPVDSLAFWELGCTDYYPDWSITLTYEDGTQVSMETHGNMLTDGGPWGVTINSKYYLQIGYGIPEALVPIVAALTLPSEIEPSIFCVNTSGDLLLDAFPDR